MATVDLKTVSAQNLFACVAMVKFYKDYLATLINMR